MLLPKRQRRLHYLVHQCRREGIKGERGLTPVNSSISFLNLFLSNLAPPEVSRLNADAIVVVYVYVYVYYIPSLSILPPTLYRNQFRNSDSVDDYTVGYILPAPLITPPPLCSLPLNPTAFLSIVSGLDSISVQQQHNTIIQHYNNNDKDTPRRPTTYHMRSLRLYSPTTRSSNYITVEPPNIRIRQNASIQAIRICR